MKVVRLANLQFLLLKGYEIYLDNVIEDAACISDLENLKDEIKETDHWDKVPDDVDLESYSAGLTSAIEIIDSFIERLK